MAIVETKKWYQSKTKLGTIIAGVGLVLTTVGGYLQGSIDVSTLIPAVMTEVGIILGIMGIRDIPFLNKA